MFLFRTPPIRKQIALYCQWKAVRYPTASSQHAQVLLNFTKYAKVRHVREITFDTVNAYASRYDGEAQRRMIFHAIQQFLKYWAMMGEFSQKVAKQVKYDSFEPIVKNMGRPRDLVMARRVQEMRPHLSFRAIQRKLREQDSRTYDLKCLNRWAHYDLPEGTI